MLAGETAFDEGAHEKYFQSCSRSLLKMSDVNR